MTIACCVSG